MTLIVDASVAIKWFVDEEGSDEAARLLGQPAHAPELLIPECLSALRKMVARGIVSAEVAQLTARTLQIVGVTFEPMQPLAADTLALSLRLSHSVYDCAYLALACRLDGVLVTADEKLVARCRRGDAPELAGRVQSLYAMPPMVQERALRPYRARPQATLPRAS